MNRASSEQLEAQSQKALAKKVKDAQVIQTLKTAIKEELQAKTIDELLDDDVKYEILQNVIDDLYAEDFFNSKLEADAYYYTIEAKYDGLIKKLQNNKTQTNDEDLQAQKNEDIKIILKGVGVALLIVFAPFIFIAFVIYQVLKNMK